MDNSSIGSIKNYDSSYFRTLIVGIMGFFWEKLYVPQMENGEESMVNIPIYYSRNGEEQFLIDYFQDTDKYRNELCLEKVQGTVNKIPSGIFTAADLSVNTQFITSRYVRSNFKRRIKTEFGDTEKMVSARTEMIPIGMKWDVEIKASSDVQRWMIIEKVIKTFRRVKQFKFTYDGYDAIPCMVGFSSDFNINRDIVLQYPGGEDKRPKFKFTIETLSYLPTHDDSTVLDQYNRIETLKLVMDNKKSDG